MDFQNAQKFPEWEEILHSLNTEIDNCIRNSASLTLSEKLGRFYDSYVSLDPSHGFDLGKLQQVPFSYANLSTSFLLLFVSGKKKASSIHDGIFQEDFFCVDGTDFYSSPKLLQHASRETQKKINQCWHKSAGWTMRWYISQTEVEE